VRHDSPGVLAGPHTGAGLFVPRGNFVLDNRRPFPPEASRADRFSAGKDPEPTASGAGERGGFRAGASVTVPESEGSVGDGDAARLNRRMQPTGRAGAEFRAGATLRWSAADRKLVRARA
jgi:hypothetical protein